MSNFKPLVIGDLKIEKPVIQGGMGVGISLHRLAGAVAKAGGMGLISTAQIGFREPDFKTNFVEDMWTDCMRETAVRNSESDWTARMSACALTSRHVPFTLSSTSLHN